MIHAIYSRYTGVAAFLFFSFCASAYSGVWVELKNQETIELQQVEDLSTNLDSDLTLGLDAFEGAFVEVSEAELIENFGESKDIRAYYSNLFEEDDVALFRDGKMTWIRAFLKGDLVGWMTLLPQFREERTVYVSSLVVSPQKQKLGIGQKLLESISQHWFPKSKELNLVVRKINRGAIHFYTRIGFVAAPDINSSFVGNPLLCFFMRLVKQVNLSATVAATGQPL